jgi:hypothetical protein
MIIKFPGRASRRINSRRRRRSKNGTPEERDAKKAAAMASVSVLRPVGVDPSFDARAALERVGLVIRSIRKSHLEQFTTLAEASRAASRTLEFFQRLASDPSIARNPSKDDEVAQSEAFGFLHKSGVSLDRIFPVDFSEIEGTTP